MVALYLIGSCVTEVFTATDRIRWVMATELTSRLPETRDVLRAMKAQGETYDELLRRLCEDEFKNSFSALEANA